MSDKRTGQILQSLLPFLEKNGTTPSVESHNNDNLKALLIDISNALTSDETLTTTLLDFLPDAVAVLEKSGRVIKVNKLWEEYHLNYQGLSLPTLGGHLPDAWSKNGTEHNENVPDGIHSVLKQQIASFEGELSVISGRQNWFRFRAIAMAGSYTALIITDITVAVIAQKQTEQRFYAILDKMPDGVLIIDIGGRYKYLNDAAARQSSYSKAELLGHPMTELYPGIQSTDFYKSLKACMKERKSYQLFNESGFKDHPTGHFEVNIYPVAEGFLVLSEDITERKKGEVLLIKSRQNYRRVIDNISDALMIDDVDGKVVYANDRFLNLYGFTDEDLEHLVLEDYIAPEYREILRDRHTRRIAGEDVPEKFIYEGLHKDGTRLWLEVKVSKIVEHGKVTGTQSAIRNITEEKETLERLRSSEAEKTKLLDELTKKYNELMQFNYIVSHNLRAPIANMIGLCEIISMDGISDDEKWNILEDVKRVVTKMDELVKDLNVILSLNSPLNEKKVACPVRNMIYGITHTLEKQIKESGTIINADIADDCNKIVTIKSYLESILYNLISNAIKYKSPDRTPRIDITVKRNSYEWIISVADNGMGINLVQNRKYLFGLYKRFNFDVGGKGLGLHMTKVQVEALGGDIAVESTVNKGTTFIIKLPIG